MSCYWPMVGAASIGSSHVHWLRVQVDPQSDAVFTVTQEIVPGNP
jgi:hypothetical protein